MAIQRIRVLESSSDRLRIGPSRWACLAEWVTEGGFAPFVAVCASVLLWDRGPRFWSVLLLLAGCATLVIVLAASAKKVDEQFLFDRKSDQLVVTTQPWFGGRMQCTTHALTDVTEVCVLSHDIVVHSYPDAAWFPPEYVYDVGLQFESGNVLALGRRDKRAQEVIEIARLISEFLGLPTDGLNADPAA